MENPNNIPVMRHFDDIDDLLNFGRDSDLVPGQEDVAAPIARELYEEAKKEGKEVVIFICSNKKRAIQTAKLIADQIHNIDGDFKTRISSEDDLSAIYQGEFVLPSDYKPGDKFAGFELGNKIFAKEVFSNDNPNYLYHFGDPVLQEDGIYKYPELIKYFKSYGECNRDLLLRIYGLIVKTHEKINKLNSKTKVVAITHSQLYQVFRDLATIADMIKNDDFNFDAGQLPKLCWELYSERFKKEKPNYDVNFISIESLYDPDIIELLKREIEYLKNLK